MGRLRALSSGSGRVAGMSLAGDGGSPLRKVSVVNPLHAPEHAAPGARPTGTGYPGGLEML